MNIKDCVLIEPFTCKEDEAIVEVARKLRSTTLRHIFVVNNENFPTGIISVIDVNNRIVAEGKDPTKLKARDVMTKPVDIIDINDDVGSVSKNMLAKNRVMGPVVNNNKMIGIITLHQVLKNCQP